MSAETSINDWQRSFEKEIDLLRLASTEGNAPLVTIYQEKTPQMITTEATFSYINSTAMDISTIYEVSDVYAQLKEKLDTAIKETEADCSAIHKSMQRFKETKSDATERVWEMFLTEEVEKQKAASNKRWDDLKCSGVEKIKKLPEVSRPDAAKIYCMGLSVCGKLASQVINWLKDRMVRIHELPSKAGEKIAEFGQRYTGWINAAFSTVTGAFGSIFANYAAVNCVQNDQLGGSRVVSPDRDSVSGVTLEQAK